MNPTYNKTVFKSKSLMNYLRKAFTWLQQMQLIPSELGKKSSFERMQHYSLLIATDIIDEAQRFSFSSQN